jgi:hypothetical protein
MKTVFEIPQWVTPDEVEKILAITESWEKVPFAPNYGRWPGELISVQSWHKWNDQDELGQLIGNRLYNAVGRNTKIVEVNYQQLHLPWDVHADLSRDDKGSTPWYSVIIPLGSYNSRTIIFDQESPGYNDFYLYKQKNNKADHPVDLDFWNNNLSHCWDEDREYLSLKYVGREQRAGDAFFFSRKFMHSSDDFHTRGVGPKRFLQILIDLV